MSDKDSKVKKIKSSDFRHHGLGRGLDSLIPMTEKKEGIEEIEIEKIKVNPHQPRIHFDEESLGELAQSIKEHGILQPLVVSKKGDEYEIIVGERRLRAAKIAGLTKIPTVKRSLSEHQKLELALVENVQRSDLNALEKAYAFKKLMDEFNMTQEEISKKVGKSRSAVANTIRILNLPKEIKKGLMEGKITEGHAKAILMEEDSTRQLSLYKSILSQGLNVREVERKARSVRSPKVVEIPLKYRELIDNLRNILGTKVSISGSKKGGKLIIEYYSEEELNRIYKTILKSS